MKADAGPMRHALQVIDQWILIVFAASSPELNVFFRIV